MDWCQLCGSPRASAGGLRRRGWGGSLTLGAERTSSPEGATLFGRLAVGQLVGGRALLPRADWLAENGDGPVDPHLARAGTRGDDELAVLRDKGG
jgi:hypothetical protein